jgi:hypothetical protein
MRRNMAIKAMLSLDLNNVTNEQREAFYAALKERKWAKITSLTTVWKATFQEGVTGEQAIKETKNDLASAAQLAKVTRYDAGVMVGEREPEIYSIPYRHG